MEMSDGFVESELLQAKSFTSSITYLQPKTIPQFILKKNSLKTKIVTRIILYFQVQSRGS